MTSDAKYDPLLRWLCDEPLTSLDKRDILELLKSDDSAGELILADQSMNALLLSLGQWRQDRDRFIAAVFEKASRVPEYGTQEPEEVESTSQSIPWYARLNLWYVGGAMAASVLLASCVFLYLRANHPSGQVAAVPVPNGPPVAQIPPPNVTQPLPEVARPLPSAPPAVPVVQGVATLVGDQNAVWDAPHHLGDQIPIQTMHLLAGEAVLHLNRGTTARIKAPTTLDLAGANEIHLSRGQLSVQVPPEAIGFIVTTPVSRLVDRGSNFDVSVQDNGKTTTNLLSGEMTISPQQAGVSAGEPVELASGQLDAVTVSSPPIAFPFPPLTTAASGDHGQFFATVSYGGRTAEFHSPADLAPFQAQVLRQLQQSPAQFSQAWPALVDSLRVSKPAVAPAPNRASPASAAAAARLKLRQQLEDLKRQTSDPEARQLIQSVEDKLDQMK